MKSSIFQETASAVAKRFGVSVKAPRIYEELGLMKPARKHFTPGQLRALRARTFTPADRNRVGAAWSQIFSDVIALGPDPDPASPDALDIAPRADVLLADFTGGDPRMPQAASKMKSKRSPIRSWCKRCPRRRRILCS